jgi:hypothetical protein
MKFAIRILCGAGIVALTALASIAMPLHAVGIGWLGASLYFILIYNRN